MSVTQLAQQAHEASAILATADTETKNNALRLIADKIIASQTELQRVNTENLEVAREHGLSDALLDRLELTIDRIKAMANSLREIADLPDPIGRMSKFKQRPSGIRIATMRVPIGVIGIIYESRPNVTADAAGLCLKSGNAAILRGGSEALQSNCAIADCIEAGLVDAGLPKECIGVIRTSDRDAVGEMLACNEYIDVIIPRGGSSLIQRVIEESTIPVIKHLHGVCHIFVDCDADKDKALNIIINAKTQRCGVCNAMETLLIDETISADFLPRAAAALREKGVELRVCEKSLSVLPDAKPATEEDWTTEYLAPILSIRLVKDIEEAIQHIRKYGSQHTDAIVTENSQKISDFIHQVDSSSVMVNASTRFADGGEYGLGAEIGISTDKLHARGPVGIEGLTTYKYVVFGAGHVRQ